LKKEREEIQMTDSGQFERWKKVRAKGMAFFIIVYGLLWGIFMFAIMTLTQFAIGKFSPGYEIEYFFEPTNLLVYGGVFLVFGLAWAAVNWFVSERRFKNHGQD
jgi:hypothetical protein